MGGRIPLPEMIPRGSWRCWTNGPWLIPDRPGNNQIDSLQNIIEHPHVGLLFLVPGMNETLRVSGTAKITTDPALLKPLCVDGKHPSPMRISVNSTSGPRANKARISAKFARGGGGRSINLYKDLKNGKSTWAAVSFLETTKRLRKFTVKPVIEIRLVLYLILPVG